MPPASRPGEPAFSVVITLTDTRGVGERCVAAWAGGQTLPRDRYEVIVVANGAAPALERRVRDLLHPGDLFLVEPSENEFLLYDIAARRARGRHLFFTEGHCVPGADCLARVFDHLEANPGAAGGRTASVPGETPAPLSRHEARQFEEHFARVLAQEPWLRVLVHGFALRRDVYLAEGGFEHQLGQFAEWALAIRLHRHGLRMDYIPSASVRHYLAGDLAVLSAFVRDFTVGEMEYRSRYPPEEWLPYLGHGGGAEGGPQRRLPRGTFLFAARAALRATRQGRGGAMIACADTAMGVLPRVLLGDRWLLLRSRLDVAITRWCATWLADDPVRGYPAFQRYWQAIVEHWRLDWALGRSPVPEPGSPCRLAYPLATVPAWRLGGFFAVESHGGRLFRWSEPAAHVTLSLPPGAYRLRLALVGVEGVALPPVALFLDGRSIPIVRRGRQAVEARIGREDVRPGHRQALTLVTRPLRPRGTPDRRTLGLPIASIDLEPLP